MLEFLSPLAWVVHPLGGILLAFVAANIFSRRRRLSEPVLVAVLLLLALSVLGAGWVVHPAAGLMLALLASVIFHAWRREARTILAALAALAFFAWRGADWALYPLAGLLLAWLPAVLFSGALWRRRPLPSTVQAQPAALSAQAADDPLLDLNMRVDAGQGRRTQKRLARAERRADGEVCPQRFQVQVVAAPAPTPAPDLLSLSRDERLPADARARLGALHFRCAEALAYLREREQDSGHSGFLLRQIAADYAPEAVQAYLKLPRSLADVTPLQGGKTGRTLLNEQLELLLGAVRDMLEGAAQAGSQHLLSHQRFLQGRFAPPPDDLKL